MTNPDRPLPSLPTRWARSMASRTAACVGCGFDYVDDASGSVSDRAAREAVRIDDPHRTDSDGATLAGAGWNASEIRLPLPDTW